MAQNAGGSSAVYLSSKVFGDCSIITIQKINHTYKTGIYLLHFLKQHLTTFVVLVYRCGLEALALYFFNEMFLTYRVPSFRGRKVVKHGGHWGISFLLLIELGPICNSMAASF